MAKILIADDEPEVRKALCDIVQAAGHEGEEAYDGFNALDKIREFKPDVLLLDWMLPELYGGEVLHKLRNDPAYEAFKNTIVIVVSDFDDEKSLNDFRQAGADDFVIKVDDPEALKGYLLKRIDDLLNAST